MPSFRLLLACALCCALSLTGLAQTTGTISGRVLDARSRSPLPGVQVAVDDQSITAGTARDGSFVLTGVNAGARTVTFSYLGYAPVTRQVQIAAGADATLEVALGGEIVTLAEFKVEGVREGQARALNQQKTAGNIKNIIAADAIGHFPDKNVAESLQRIAGVSTVSLRGEPNYVTIRGATPQWNSVTFDGMSVLSANGSHSDALGGDMRSVPMDVLSTSQVGSMEVVKAVTPDLDGDSIGGAVLLKGRSAFDYGRRIVGASLAGSYNDLADKSGYRGTFSYTDVLGANRDWGVSVSYSKEKKTELEQSNETNDWFAMTATVNGNTLTGFVPTTLLQTYIYDERRRETVSAALEKKVGPLGRLYVRGFWNKFTEEDERYGSRYMPGLTATGGNLDLTRPVTLGSDGTFTQFSSSRATARRQVQPQSWLNYASGVTGGGAWQAADWGLEGSLSFSRATEDFTTDLGQWTTKANTNNASFDYTDPNFWRWTQNSGTSFLDPAAYGMNSSRHRQEFSKNEEYAGRLDANRSIEIAGTPVKFQTGWRSRWNTKYDSNDVANYGVMRSGTLDLSDSRLGSPAAIAPDFLDGRYNFGPFPRVANWAAFFNANRAALNPQTGQFVDPAAGLFVPNLSSTLNATLANDYKSHEDIHAGYARADWSIGKLGLIAGVRFEKTDFDIRAVQQNTTVANTNPARYQPYRQTQSYDNWLPGLHLRYEARKNLILRFAWTNTIARPSAVALLPNFTVDPINLTISGGNPALHPVESMNWDISAEYYLSSIGIVSVGAFAKQIDGPIYNSSSAITYDAGSGPQRFIYNTSLNADKATLRGVEISYTQQLRFLPSPLDGLGLYANYTLTDSSVDVPSRPGESFPLFNQSKWLGNVALFYQKYDLSARLAYNFRSGYLTTLVGPGTDTFWDSDHRLDLQIGYKFLKHWTVQLQANNLENSPERQYHGNASRQEYYGLTGRFYSLGLSWEL